MPVPDALWQAAWAERPSLLAIARRRSRTRADAEEIVSEAILRAVSHPTLNPDRLPAMLRATVLRLCVDRLRERSVFERHRHRLFTRAPDEQDDVLDRAEAQWLASAMEALADKERAALTARMLGLTVAETAEALGVSYKSAESALDRAKRKMRAVWARTLGLLPLRLRRRSGVTAGLVVAMAVTATLTVWQPWHRGRGSVDTPVVPRAQVMRASGHRAAAHLPGRTRPKQRKGTALVLPVRVATPDLRVGLVRVHPSVVTLDLSDPVGRVRRCLRNGVAIQVSAPVGVICK